MSRKKAFLIVGLIIVIGLVVDLATKSIFAEVLDYGEKVIVIIPNFFRLIYIENDGAAYGMLGGKTWILIIITIAFIIGFAIYYIFNHKSSWIYQFAFGLILSGAIGNLIDRIFFDGIVRDFISIEIFSFIFNIADMWITFGVILFILDVILDYVKDNKKKKEKTSVDDTEDK